jgi:hypothetical protein
MSTLLVSLAVIVVVFGILRSFLDSRDSKPFEPTPSPAGSIENEPIPTIPQEDYSMLEVHVNINDVDYTFRYAPGSAEATAVGLATYFCESKAQDFPDKDACTSSLAAELETRMKPIEVSLWLKIGSEYHRVGFEYLQGMNANYYANVGATKYCESSGFKDNCMLPISDALRAKFSAISGAAAPNASARQISLAINEIDYVFEYSSTMDVDTASLELAKNFCLGKGKDLGVYQEGDDSGYLEMCERPVAAGLKENILLRDSVEVGTAI